MEVDDLGCTALSPFVSYARSADGDATALERQNAACAAYAACMDRDFGGFQRCYTDVGRALGPDLKALLDAAEAGKFRTLVVTDPDRLSRNTRALVAIFAKLQDAGVEVHMPRCGRVDLVKLLFLNLVGWPEKEEVPSRPWRVFETMQAAYALRRLLISGRAK